MMRKILMALALAVGFITAATAATPVAVWDGDFTTAGKGGYTLELKSGGALPTEAGALALAADVLKINKDSATSAYANGAIVVKYSNYAANATLANTALASANVPTGSEDAGCEANGGILKAYWGTTVNRTLNAQIGSYVKDNVEVSASGYLILAYNTTSGTAAFLADANKSEWKGGYDSGIKWQGKTVQGFAIGGPRQASPASTMGPCATMTIEAVALFENYNGLTQAGIEELMAYQFTSDYLSEKYHNQMGGTAKVPSAKVPAATYGAITVPGNGYKATALTGKTELSTSGTGIGGNFNGMFQSGVDVASHTVSGWFKVDELPASGSYKLLWSVRNDQTSYGGYGAVVGSDGKIYVGRTTNDNATPALENYNAKSSEAVITAGAWCYLTLSFEKASGARTATLKVYKNGGSAISFDATSNTGCNGGTTTSKFYVGAAGVSVAGFYIDNGVLSNVDSIKMLATSSKYVVAALGEYSASLEESTTWTAAPWNPALPEGGMTATDMATVTASGNPTLTLDGTITVDTLKIVSEAGNMLTVKKDAEANTTVGSLDVSEAADGTTWDATDGFTACSALLTTARTVNNKFYFLGEGENGATLDYGSTTAARINENPLVSGHLVFDGGTHVFKSTSENGGQNFGANATVDNPTFYVKNGATLNWYSRNPCGWSVQANANGIVRIDGTSKIKTMTSESGTWYWAQQFYLEPGAELELATSQMRFTGGANANGAHFFMPASEDGEATVSASNNGSFYLTKDSYPGVGVNVGAGSTLKVTANLNSSATQAFIAKFGAGTVRFEGNVNGFNGSFQVKAGTMLFAPKTAFHASTAASVDSGATLAFDTTDRDLSLANVVSGAGALAKTGTGTLTLTGANAYSGGTTVDAGTLKLADGATIGTGNYSVAEGATLDLPSTFRPTDAKLDASSEGTVGITLTAAELATFDEGEEMSLEIPVEGDVLSCTIRVYDSQGTEHQIESATISDGKIAVQKKTDAKVSPFNLTVTEGEDNFWESFSWIDSNPDEPQEVTGDDWAVKVAANITVSDGATAEMTVGNAVPITLSTLNIANGYKLTITRDDDATITVDAIDDSDSTGETTLDIPLGETPVKAGANTVLTKVGTGTYTVGEGKKLTVTASGLNKTQLTNNGTLNVVGGTLEEPVVINDNGSGTAGFGTVTIASGVVKDYATGGNKVYNISGVAGETTLILGSGQNWGMASGTAIRNTKVIVQDKEFWLELADSFDSTVDLQLDKALHICNNRAYTIGSLSGSANIVKTGSESLTITMDRADSEYSGASQNAMIVAGTYTLTLSGNSTGALTVNEGATVKLAGSAAPSSISNAGKVIFDVPADTTKTVAYAITGAGTVEVTGEGAVIFKESSGVTPEKVTGGAAYFAKTVSVNNCGEYTPVAPYTTANVKLYYADGTPVDNPQVSGGKITFDWKVTGGACWWDYEFEGNGNNTGTEGTALSWDSGRPFKDNEYVTDETTGEMSLHIPARPWRDVSSWPTTATFVMYGTMVKDANKYYVVFGSTTGGTKNTVFLATDDIDNSKVVLCRANGLGDGATVTKLCTMTVPNAKTAKHLYAFVLKTAGEKTTIDIYLDGELLQSYPFAEVVTLGSGFQIASPHGGEVKGYARPANDDPALLDWLRVYNVELTQEALEKYALKYPYVSPNGSYQRTVTAGDLWTAENAWTKEGTTPEQTDVPAAGSTVKLTVDGATTLGVNLDADVSYEAIKITGDDLTVALATGEQKGKVISAGRVTAGANVTFKYDAFTMFNAPLTVKAGKTVTFDLSMVDMTKFFTTQTYDLTGYTTLETGATVTFTPPAQLYGREITAEIDETTKHYILTVTVPVKDFNYTNGNWTWGDDQPVDGVTVSNNTALAINVKSGTLEWGIDRATINVKGGTLKATAVPTAACAVTVEEDATFDLNGIEPTSTVNNYTVTLNGGTLANSAEAMGLIKSLTITEDSTVDTSVGKIAIQSQHGGYAATTLALGENTLTKTGTNRLELVVTTVSGDGTIEVVEGTLWTQENSDYGDALIYLKEDGVFEVREGKTATVTTFNGDEGGKIIVHGTISDFTFTEGDVAVSGTGTFGTIALDEEPTIDIGTKRGLTINEGGQVNATITDAEKATGSVTVFTSASETKPGSIYLYDEQGKSISGFPGAYNEQGQYVVTFYVDVTIPTIANISGKIVEVGGTVIQPEAGGETYKVLPGSNVKTTYTAAEGYLFENGEAVKVLWLENAQQGSTLDVSGTESKQAEAKIGTKLYLTLQNAINAAGPADTIELCANAAVSGEIAKVVNLDLSGFGLAVATTDAKANITITNSKATGGVQIASGGTLTVYDGATVDMSALAQGTAGGEGSVFVQDGATLKYPYQAAKLSPGWLYCVYPNMVGGAKGATIVTDKAYVKTLDKTADGEEFWQAEDDVAMAKVTTKSHDPAFDYIEGFADLATAASWVKAGETVTLLADTSADGVALAKNATFDLNGKNLTVATGFASSADLTLVNGVAGQGGFVVGGTVSVNGGTLDASALPVAVGGVIPGQAGGIAVANGATFVMMNEWAAYSPNWLAANREGFLAAADGGMVKMGATVYTAQNGLFGTENTVAKAVTTVGTLTYTETFDSLAAAIAAANADTTVTLVADASVGELTLDKGFTLDVDGNVATFGGAIDITAGTVALKNSQSTAPEMGTSAGGILVGAPISVAAGAALDLSLMPFGKDVYGGIDANPPTAYLDLASGATAKFFYWGLATKEEVDTPNWMYGNLPIFFKDGAIPDGATVVIGTKTWTGDAEKGRFVIENEIAIATVQGVHQPATIDPSSTTFTFTESFDSVAMAFAAATDKTATLTADYTLPGNKTLAADETLVLGGTLTIPNGVTNTVYGTLKCNATGSNFINLSAMLIGQSASVYMGEAKMFGSADGKFSIQAGEIVQTTNTGDPSGGMKYTISADGAATMVGDFIEWAPGVYCLDTFWLNDGATFTAVDADEEQGLKCVKAVNPEKKIVCNAGVYSVADKGPAPAPGSDVKVDPVPGQENTYVVKPTGESKDVLIDNVKDGDTLIINGAAVDSLKVDNKNGVTVVVSNRTDSIDITDAVVGWVEAPVMVTSGFRFKTASAGYTWSNAIKERPVIESLAFNAGGEPVVGVTNTVNGIFYTLMRKADLDDESEAVTEEAMATDVTMPLTDADTERPADKAFYEVKGSL